MEKRISKGGFTLFELLLIMAIIVILGTTGVGFYRNYVKSVEVKSAGQMITADLKSARAKAMTGEDGLKWGAHFINGPDDYYEVFSTDSDYSGASVKTTTFLPKAVMFSIPGEGSSLDIIFSKISGTATDTAVVVSSEGQTVTITVTSQGSIF